MWLIRQTETGKEVDITFQDMGRIVSGLRKFADDMLNEQTTYRGDPEAVAYYKKEREYAEILIADIREANS